MTTEELNAIIAKAEAGDVAAMNKLTHIYSEEDGYINSEQAAKWFLALIQKDCDPNSGVYEKTGFDKNLYEKVKNTIQDLSTEKDLLSSFSGGNAGGSLLGGAMAFTTSKAKSYINQAEDVIKSNNIYKEEQRRKAEQAARKKAEEAARKRAEEERARREAAERARREREEKARLEREQREREERARKEAVERARREREKAQKEAADKEAARKVIDGIMYIGDVEYTVDCKKYIDSARAAYDSLTADQKELVNNLNVLISAEKEYNKLYKAELERLERERLEQERKRKAEKEAADREAAQKVIDKIACIGIVEYTAVSKESIDSARNAYEALTADQKRIVSNSLILYTAEEKFEKLKRTEEIKAAEEEAKRNRIQKEAADREAARKAMGIISNIGTVVYSEDCQILIEKAEEAYAALTLSQKGYVENFDVLYDAKKKLEWLKNAAEEEAKRKAEEAERARKKAEEEAEARERAEAEEKKIAKFKATESWLQKYCIENDSSISIEWNRLERQDHYSDILEYLKSLNDEQFTFASNGVKYVVRAYPYGEIKVIKYYQDASLQQQAEEQIRLRIIRRQIETDWPSSSVFKDEVGSFTIPKGSARIGNHAFAKCAKLRTISIPESVVTIGEQAFERCERLETVQLPNGVTNIGIRAFYCCRELKTIFLGNSLTKIEYGAFEHCVNLTSIVLPNSVTSIGNSAFGCCSNLKSITLSPNMTYIGDRAFEGCQNLKEIVVPKGKKEEYLSLLKYSHADGVNIIEKTYSKERSQSRANNTSEKGGILSSLWKALTGN